MKKSHTAPEAGSLAAWEGPMFGKPGVLARDGDTLQCHCCGGSFRSLASHAFLAHGLRAHEYRTLFGLRAKTALVGQALSDLRRRLAAPRLRAYQPLHQHYVTDQTSEERSLRRRTQPLALEARLDPVNLEQWRAQSAKGRETRRGRFRDPAYRQRVGQRISEAKGGRIEVVCAVCGTAFRSTRSAADDGQRQLCSPACIAEFRRRWGEQLVHLPRWRRVAITCEECGTTVQGRRGRRFCSGRCKHRTYDHQVPGTCPSCGAAFMGARGQRYCSPGCSARLPRPGLAARLSDAARQRGRPHAEALRALPSGTLDALPPLEREVVRRYYGLDGGRPQTQREIAHALRIACVRVGPLTAQAVARLLGRHDQSCR